MLILQYYSAKTHRMLHSFLQQATLKFISLYQTALTSIKRHTLPVRSIPKHRVYILINVKKQFIYKCYRHTHRKQQKKWNCEFSCRAHRHNAEVLHN